MNTNSTIPEPLPADAFTTPLPEPAVLKPTGYVRWLICGLLFFATAINYMDRQILGLLKPDLAKELHWTDSDFANIVFGFQLMYAIGQLSAGRFVDFLGVRLGYTLAVIGWSFAAMGHGLARTVTGFVIARGALGLAEGGNFPSAIKAVAEWFPKRERALATGIFNAGSNVGAMMTPLLVPLLVKYFGWPAAFYWTGGVGLLWVVLWLALYQRPERHKMLSAGELAYIRSSDPPEVLVDGVAEARPSAISLLLRRSTIAYVVASMLTGPVWWFYLYWVPDFLNKKYGLDLIHLGLPLAVIYLMTDFGSIGGGWVSSHLISRGWSVNAARKAAMLTCALCVLPVFFASVTANLWLAVLLIGLAAAAHQGWSANLYTFVSDTTSKASVGMIVGMGGFAGGLAGMGVAKLVGYILDHYHSYYSLFAGASVMYLIALAIIQLLVPRIGEVNVRRTSA